MDDIKLFAENEKELVIQIQTVRINSQDTKTRELHRKHEGGLITAIRNETDNTMNNRMTINRK